jgi:hypothetical protein
MPARVPWSISVIQKLGGRGHEVFVADSVDFAAGSHSRFAAGHFVIPAPARDTPAFIAEVTRLCEQHRIERILPMFEETLFLAYHRDDLPPSVDLFAGEFESLARLHDKATFVEFVRASEVRVPETLLARDQAELKAAIAEFPEYIARPAYSRAALAVLTNVGPRAGELPIEFSQPTEDNPWLVQPFIRGEPLCSFSVAHRGKVRLHVSYAIPRVTRHGWGIQVRSIADKRIEVGAAKVIEATGLTGCVSFDWLDADDGLFAVECNVRATLGELLVAPPVLDQALTGDGSGPASVVEAGRRAQLDAAIIHNLRAHRAKLHPTLIDLVTVRDGMFKVTDAVPFLYYVLQNHRLTELANHEQRDLVEVLVGDWSWNGQLMT